MSKTLMVGVVVLALLWAIAAPGFAAGPRQGAGPGAGGSCPGCAMGMGPGRGHGGGMGPGAGPRAEARAVPGIPQDVHDAIETAVRGAAARVLNMTADDLGKALTAGKTMATIAAEKNVPLTTVQNAMLNARRFAINQALAAGKITREQATALLQTGPGFARGQGAGMRAGAGPQMGMHRHGHRR